tara:strand:+ start:26 stop:706 length:681 start_codon:yes stop_codon:yes gene_type:complete
LKEITQDDIINIGLLDFVRKELRKDYLINKERKFSNEEIEKIKKRWCFLNKISSEKDLEIWKKINKISNEKWEDLITKEIRWGEWCLCKFNNQLKDYFFKRKPFLDKVIYSLIRVSEFGLAQEIFLRIKEGENNFSELSSQYSLGDEKNNNGIVGPISINKSHKEINNLLKISRINQLWPPILIENWWVIVRLDNKIEAELDNEISLMLAKELGEKFLNENMNIGK